MTEHFGQESGIQQKASQAAGQAADTVRGAGETVRGQVEEQVGSRSTQAGDQLGSVGDAMRQAGDQLRSQGNQLPAQLAGQAAEQVDRVSRYLRESDGDTILRDVEDFARRQPWIVAGIGLAVGLGAARLLKASGSRARERNGQTGSGMGPVDQAVPPRAPEPVAAEPPYPIAPVPPPPDPSFARPVPPAEDPWAGSERRR